MTTRSVLGLLVFSSALAAEPLPRPRFDPADQLFRRAPMAESSRSIVVNLSTNLHYAFDADSARIHSVWKGAPLNLWGPPYSYSKSPFVCDFSGQVLFSFPQVHPWWNGSTPLKTRFRSISTLSNQVTFAYDLLLTNAAVRVEETAVGSADDEGWELRRSFCFPNGTEPGLEFLAFAEANGGATSCPDGILLSGTNGSCMLATSNTITSLIRTNSVSYSFSRVTEAATETGFKTQRFEGEETRVYLGIPFSKERSGFDLSLRHGQPRQRVAPSRQEERQRVFTSGAQRRAPGGDPYYRVEFFPLPPQAEMMITGMDWLPNGDLAVCTWLGEIYFVKGARGDVSRATYHRFATGLMEPLGLAVDRGVVYVMQKGELTRVLDSDGDGLADRFDCVSSDWGFSGNYHSYSFGPLITPTHDFFAFITGQRGLYDLAYQGWALQISSDGDQAVPFCHGLRVPHGWGYFGPDRDIFVTDNQGNWIGACRLNHLQAGKFYGFPSSTPAKRGSPRADEVEPPVLWFPRALAPSASGFATAPNEGFGPFGGQLFIGDFQNSIVMRACLERVHGKWQGAVFPFAKGFLSGVNRLRFGPDSKLYVGGGKRTWSTAAPMDYSLDRVVFTGKVPFEVAEVRATRDGFKLRFTRPVEKKSAADPANYLLKQFNYKYHADYGSPEFDHSGKVGATEVRVSTVELREEGRAVRLHAPGLKTGFVTSFQLALSSGEDEDLRQDTFYYTLNEIPDAQ